MPNPTAAILIIGNEILSGRTHEGNGHWLAGELNRRGIELREIRVVTDEMDAISAALKSMTETADHVFTSGGIGPTHDDITADAVAAFFGVSIDVREDARMALAQNYPKGEADLTPARLRMARIPEGATLIDNPISHAPGFTIGNVHVMAGVPNIFRAMAQNVLPSIPGGVPQQSLSVQFNGPESALADQLRQIAKDNPDVAIGSYPHVIDGKFICDVVLRGPDSARLEQVAALVPTHV